ncbi:Putative, 10TM heavy-metal exporter [Micromonospora purpureochromogenes]|uniref:Putative, 10TM heavy-metal exporter n=1 Tax=Micromonospora purpureochromogenes TaxID=47872 RepID=A0A1C4Y7U1_9ACTN|nr:putative manganese transporter [Micromonospora purpureochromogenes]SCF16401.1 Putative, 10TM heavy-metal exporter [Micromonospora purpureochromogenes]
MIELVVRPLADAFMQVGVYVAVMVALFGWLRWRYGDRITDGLTHRPRLGPLVGALLGVSPGCGGAIVLMPLYARGKVSFGTVVAALAATMGDSSWVVLAWNPLFALKIHMLLFAVGLVTGYVVDALGIDPAHRRARPDIPAVVAAVPAPATSAARVGGTLPAGVGHAVPAASTGAAPAALAGPAPTVPVGSAPAAAVGLTPAGPVDAVPAQPVPAVPVGPGGGSACPRSRGTVAGRAGLLDGLRRRDPATAFWGLTTPAFAVSVPVVFQLVDPTVLTRALGGVDPYLALGVLGTLAAVLIFAAGRGRLADDSLETAYPQSLRETLRHSAHEASFVTVWVAVAYLGWQVFTTVTGFNGSQLALTGLLGVLVGAAIGLIPGCAVQIVFTGLYVSGGLPLPTLVANAISQDGDALIPLAALRRHSAALATVITTIPAAAVGAALLVLL